MVKNFGVCDFSRLGGCGLALAALALVLFGAYDSYPGYVRSSLARLSLVRFV